MKIKVVKNVYLVCKKDGSLELQYGSDYLHTPNAKERNSEIKDISLLPDVVEVFYLKHVVDSIEVDESVLGGLI